MNFEFLKNPSNTNRFMLALSVSSVAVLVVAVPLAVAAINAPANESTETLKVYTDDGSSYVVPKSALVKEPSDSVDSDQVSNTEAIQENNESTSATNETETRKNKNPSPPTLSPVTQATTFEEVTTTKPEPTPDDPINPEVDPGDPVDEGSTTTTEKDPDDEEEEDTTTSTEDIDEDTKRGNPNKVEP